MSQELKPCPFCGSDDVTVKGAANAWNSRADEPKRIDGKPAGMSAEQFDACYEEDGDEDAD